MALSWEYIAGFFDGEGSIRIENGNRGGAGVPQMAIHQSAERGLKLLREIQLFLESYDIHTSLNTQCMNGRSAHTKQMYRLYCYNRKGVIAFLRYAMPHLHIKKAEAQDLLRYLTIFPILPGSRFHKPKPRPTHCSAGHELTPDNVYSYGNARQCCICAKQRANDRYERLKFERRVQTDPAVRGWL